MNRRHSSRFSDGPWLIVSAWPPELARLRSARPGPLSEPRPFVLGTVGVGLVEAAIGTTQLIAAHRPAAVLLIGTAGVYPGHHAALPVGSAAAVAEMALLPGAEPGARWLWPGSMPVRERSSRRLLARLVRATQLPTANVVCPIAMSASRPPGRRTARGSASALENLEAFAVARAAATAGVPFAAILGIANEVGPSGHREWQGNARTAAAAACEGALTFLATLAGTHLQAKRR